MLAACEGLGLLAALLDEALDEVFGVFFEHAVDFCQQVIDVLYCLLVHLGVLVGDGYFFYLLGGG